MVLSAQRTMLVATDVWPRNFERDDISQKESRYVYRRTYFRVLRFNVGDRNNRECISI